MSEEAVRADISSILLFSLTNEIQKQYSLSTCYLFFILPSHPFSSHLNLNSSHLTQDSLSSLAL